MRNVPFESGSPVVVDGDMSAQKLSTLLRYRQEYEELDYKRTIDLASRGDLVEFAKDIGAFLVLGGYIVGGADDFGRLTGDMDGFDRTLFDEQRLIPKLERYLPQPLRIDRAFFRRNGHDVVLLFVHPSNRGYAIFKRDGQYGPSDDRTCRFREGEIFWRNGTRSVRITGDKLEEIIAWRIEKGIAEAAAGESLTVRAGVSAFLLAQREEGKAPSTLATYERVLSRFVDQHRQLKLSDFEPPEGTQRLRTFLDRNWGRRKPGTRRTVRSALKSFFDWCLDENHVTRDPVRALPQPEGRGTTRRAPNAEFVLRVIEAQPSLRDRVAIQLMARLALRKGELRLLRWRDINLVEQQLHITRRGRPMDVPIDSEELVNDLESLRVAQNPAPSHFLLYPSRGRRGPAKPLERSSVHRWWERCLERVRGASHVEMDAIRGVLRATG